MYPQRAGGSALCASGSKSRTLSASLSVGCSWAAAANSGLVARKRRKLRRAETSLIWGIIVPLWLPEWLVGGDELDRDLGDEALQPIGAELHARLLRDDVAEHNETLLLARRDGVLRVLHQLPFVRLADDQHVDVGTCKVRHAGEQAAI